jgi:hypothetical protein
MSGKRSYTVPVLLLIMIVMAILLVLSYSKLLLTQQAQNGDAGQRLAERYNYALIFADRLKRGTESLLSDDAMASRLQAKAWLGEAAALKDEVAVLLAEADRRVSGQALAEALVPYVEAMTKLSGEEDGWLVSVASHEGPLEQAEAGALQIVHDGAVRMQEALKQYRPPTGIAGYRRMAAGEEWTAHAVAAGQELIGMAGQLERLR